MQWHLLFCFDSSPPPPSGLHLNSNGLAGTLPSSISSLSTLRVAYFHENGLTGSIPATLPAINLLEARHRVLIRMS
jgi:hypothetical protein